MRIRLVIIVLILFVPFAPPSRAGERTSTAPADVPQGIIESSNPAGEPLRAASRAFLKHLAAGDAKAARAMFDGPKDQAELLDACLAAVKAPSRFGKSLRARFPDDKLSNDSDVADPLNFAGQLRVIDVVTFIRQGDTASMSPGDNPINNGLEFKLAGGQWKITHLVSLRHETASHLAFAKAFASAFDDVAAKLDHGDYAKAEDAIDAVKAKLQPAFEAERAADRAGLTGPPNSR